MVYGDNNEAIRLRIFDHTTGQEYAATNESLPFVSDAIYGSPTEPYRVVAAVPTGISNVSSSDVSIFVDPSGSQLYIRYPWSSIDRVEIVDLSGRSLWQATGFTAKSISVSSLAQGTYILKVVKDNQLFVYKFIK